MSFSVSLMICLSWWFDNLASSPIAHGCTILSLDVKDLLLTTISGLFLFSCWQLSGEAEEMCQSSLTFDRKLFKSADMGVVLLTPKLWTAKLYQGCFSSEMTLKRRINTMRKEHFCFFHSVSQLQVLEIRGCGVSTDSYVCSLANN